MSSFHMLLIKLEEETNLKFQPLKTADLESGASDPSMHQFNVCGIDEQEPGCFHHRSLEETSKSVGELQSRVTLWVRCCS